MFTIWRISKLLGVIALFPFLTGWTVWPSGTGGDSSLGQSVTTVGPGASYPSLTTALAAWSSAHPWGYIAEAYDETEPLTNGAGASSRIAASVTFTSAGKIAGVRMLLSKVGTITGACLVDIFGDTAGAPSGAALASSATVYIDNAIGIKAEWVLFPFTTAYSVAAGTTLHPSLRCSTYTNYVATTSEIRIGRISSIAATAEYGVANEDYHIWDGAAWNAVDKQVLFAVLPERTTIAITGPIVDNTLATTQYANLSIVGLGGQIIQGASNTSIIDAGNTTFDFDVVGLKIYGVRPEVSTTPVGNAIVYRGCVHCSFTDNVIETNSTGIYGVLGLATDVPTDSVIARNNITAMYGIVAGDCADVGTNTGRCALQINDNNIQLRGSSANSRAGMQFTTELTNANIQIAGNVILDDQGAEGTSYGLLFSAGDFMSLKLIGNDFTINSRGAGSSIGIQFNDNNATAATGPILMTGNNILLNSLGTGGTHSCIGIAEGDTVPAALTIRSKGNNCLATGAGTLRAMTIAAGQAHSILSRDDTWNPITFSLASAVLDMSNTCSAATAVDGTTPDTITVVGATTTHDCSCTSATVACNVIGTGFLGWTPAAGSVSVAYGAGCTAPGNATVTCCCRKTP